MQQLHDMTVTVTWDTSGLCLRKLTQIQQHGKMSTTTCPVKLSYLLKVPQVIYQRRAGMVAISALFGWGQNKELC